MDVLEAIFLYATLRWKGAFSNGGRVKCKHNIFCLRSSAHSLFIPSRGEQSGGRR